jgi:hypothetical protein
MVVDRLGAVGAGGAEEPPVALMCRVDGVDVGGADVTDGTVLAADTSLVVYEATKRIGVVTSPRGSLGRVRSLGRTACPLPSGHDLGG